MPYYTKDPERDHNFDNHPYSGHLAWRLGIFLTYLRGLELPYDLLCSGGGLEFFWTYFDTAEPGNQQEAACATT